MSRRSYTRPNRRGFSQAWALLRLARPHFLAGGFLLYGLGAAIARYHTVPFSAGTYVMGQALVTSLQLMTHFLNEYWDMEHDRANPNRTWFSGGSGVLPAGLLDRDTALTLGIFCLAGAFVSAFALALTQQVTAISWLIALAAAAGAWFYSSPPLRLESSGVGEFTTSLLVAVLLPAFGYSLQAGRVAPEVLLAAAPLFALHLAMLVAFELPDAAPDEATGKRTLFVRLGAARAELLHRLSVVAAYGLLVIAYLAGVPLPVVLGGALTIPLALTQALTFRLLARAGQESPGSLISYKSVTLGGVALFAVTAGLMAFGYWRIG